MPFTASKTAACTMAATRVVTGGVGPPTSAARSIVWFQSVISSAHAVPAARPTTTNASKYLYVVLIASLLCEANQQTAVTTRRTAVAEVPVLTNAQRHLTNAPRHRNARQRRCVFVGD